MNCSLQIQSASHFPVAFAFLAGLLLLGETSGGAAEGSTARKLYWFIPDGMRADPEVFNIYQWAREGKMPNLRRMMERGTYGFAKPVFPSHTPVNFATLFTGSFPETHGVTDGPMHTEGNPLGQVSISGFSSAAKKVEPIWVTLERQLGSEVVLLSIPGSTPPELQHGITIHGRWGRWGADFPSIIFQDAASTVYHRANPSAGRLFYQGPRLTEPVAKSPAAGWKAAFQSYSPPFEATLTAWGATFQAFIADHSDNSKTDYDTLILSTNKAEPFCTLQRGQWSDWLPVTLLWQIAGSKLTREISTSVKVKLIRLEPSGEFRLRFLYNQLNSFLTEPSYVAEELLAGAGPMVDFVDNFPPQLIHFPEDKAAFLEEAGMSLDWHRTAAGFLLQKYQPQVYLQDTYTPNQMLTSRWWMGYVDPSSARYNQVSASERKRLWEEVHWLYGKLDAIIGTLLEHADTNTVVALSSDHGAVPLDLQVRLNNLFAREGLLKFDVDPQTHERTIRWKETQAVYLQMQSIYLNPEGLGGEWRRPSGSEYQALRARVRRLLLDLRDKDGTRVVEQLVAWEDAGKLRLGKDRVGDLIVANRKGYGWSEEVTEDGEIFTVPLVAGYKQAIVADRTPGLWTPFVVMGPGIRAGRFLGNQPIELVSEYPTLLRCLGVEPEKWVQGRPVREAFE